MKDEEGLAQPVGTVEDATPAHGRAGFLAGILFGAFLGAGIAMLFAPDRGEKTRSRIRRRMRNLGEDAMESIDQAGSRTRKQLSRRKRRLQKELEWLRARAKERAKEARDALD